MARRCQCHSQRHTPVYGITVDESPFSMTRLHDRFLWLSMSRRFLWHGAVDGTLLLVTHPVVAAVNDPPLSTAPPRLRGGLRKASAVVSSLQRRDLIRNKQL